MKKQLPPLPADAPGYRDIAVAVVRLRGQAQQTPVCTSRTVDARTGARVLFKCENFQRGGAFKFRGAFNALSQLDDAPRQRGVLAYSSGNHAQAIALASRLLGIRATIVMPEDAPAVKLAGTREYGAEIITYDRRVIDREELSAKLVAQRGLTLIPPYDHPQVIAGQGTTAWELFEETGPLDLLLVPCGGGGLLSGCALAARHLSPGCRVVGVEPKAGDDAARSFRTGKLATVHNPDTVADGARTPALGRLTFPLVLRHVDAMLTVTDAELLHAMRFLWERLKLVVEPTGALAAAALFSGKLSARGKKVGVVLSGGNVDLDALPALFARRT